jgi:hypothetical protein
MRRTLSCCIGHGLFHNARDPKSDLARESAREKGRKAGKGGNGGGKEVKPFPPLEGYWGVFVICVERVCKMCV